LSHAELERRIMRTRQQLGTVRAELHQASVAVSTAERAMLARRTEREEIALRLARLAELLESLEDALAAERMPAHAGTTRAG
jgi:septal ring factor EnvC (AmiA/AmiB activator)